MSRIPATAARTAASSFGRTISPRLEDFQEGREVFRVGLEVLPNGSEFPVKPGRDTRLQILRMQLAIGIRLRQGIERLVDHVAPEFRIARDLQLLLTREQDKSRHLEDRIP